jgi:hypothetical protein
VGGSRPAILRMVGLRTSGPLPPGLPLQGMDDLDHPLVHDAHARGEAGDVLQAAGAEDQLLALLAPLADPGLDLLPCALVGPQAHGMGLSEYLTKIHRVHTPQLLGRPCGVRGIDPSPLRQPQAAERGLRDPEPGLFPGLGADSSWAEISGRARHRREAWQPGGRSGVGTAPESRGASRAG